jgi:hypothetical protein
MTVDLDTVYMLQFFILNRSRSLPSDTARTNHNWTFSCAVRSEVRGASQGRCDGLVHTCCGSWKQLRNICKCYRVETSVQASDG